MPKNITNEILNLHQEKVMTELQKQVQKELKDGIPSVLQVEADKLIAKANEPIHDDFSWMDDSRYMLTGVSLSICVKQMVKQDIPTSRVWKILSGTGFRNDDQFNQLIDFYAEHYWRKYPEEAKAVCSQLRKEGKIQQVKLLPGHVSPPSAYGQDIWLEHGTLNHLNQYEEYINEK